MTYNVSKSVIITAGGSGLRMGADIPKQFIELAGKPILMRTIEKFVQFDAKIKIVVTLPESQFEFWKDLCVKHQFNVNFILTTGGETRFQSVKNALAFCKDSGYVAVHDGVRPLVSLETIKRCFDCAKQNGNAIPVIEALESIREISGSTSVSVDRNKYKMVQTPQVFETKILIDAYKQEFSPLFTDDASVVENLGHKIFLVEGNRENIKITTPIDLLIGEALMTNINR